MATNKQDYSQDSFLIRRQYSPHSFWHSVAQKQIAWKITVGFYLFCCKLVKHCSKNQLLSLSSPALTPLKQLLRSKMDLSEKLKISPFAPGSHFTFSKRILLSSMMTQTPPKTMDLDFSFIQKQGSSHLGIFGTCTSYRQEPRSLKHGITFASLLISLAKMWSFSLMIKWWWIRMIKKTWKISPSQIIWFQGLF